MLFRFTVLMFVDCMSLGIYKYLHNERISKNTICGIGTMMRETAIQNTVRLEYAKRGYQLFRNNSGCLKNDDGVPIRFGLGNDSKAANRVYKSSDLIGWEPVTITPDMVGQTIARFVSIECKPGDWTPAAPPQPGAKGERWHHEEAQRRWLDMVVKAGGTGLMVSGTGIKDTSS